MFHRTERLFLRPAFPEDASALYAAICDADIVTMLSSAPWPYRPDDAERFCATSANAKLPDLLITLPGAFGAPIAGVIGLEEKDGAADMGYWISRAYWGKGLATEAGKAMIEIARGLGHRKLLAGHYLDNPASGRVLRKLGFAETGEIRPTQCRARGGQLVLARRYALGLPGDEAARALDRARAA